MHINFLSSSTLVHHRCAFYEPSFWKRDDDRKCPLLLLICFNNPNGSTLCSHGPLLADLELSPTYGISRLLVTRTLFVTDCKTMVTLSISDFVASWSMSVPHYATAPALQRFISMAGSSSVSDWSNIAPLPIVIWEFHESLLHCPWTFLALL